MKIKVLQENLKTALGNLQKAIPSRPQLPILSSIYLKAEKNRLILAATDLYLGIKIAIPAEVSQEETLVVPGEILKNLVFSFSAGEIEIKKKANSLILKYGNSTSSLPFQSAEDYPQFPEVVGEDYSLSTLLLGKIEKLVAFAAATDQTRPILASLLFSFKEKNLNLVGTDGFRLATLGTKDGSKDLTQDLLIPVKALTEVFRLATQAEEGSISFKVAEELKQVLFIIDGAEVYVRLIEGEYPPYSKIIPPEFEYKINLDWDELNTQVKRAFLFSRDASNIIRFEVSKNKLEVKASSPAHGEYLGEINIAYSGEPLEIAFNALYLLDFLATHQAEEVIFMMNESLKPAAFKIQEEKDYLYLIMPFRTTD
jgi:DNA polymerase-3 subunit beta